MQIVPITELKDTKGIFERCRQSDEPIYVTKDGYGALVVMSMDAYERRMILSEIYTKVEMGEMSIASGRTIDAISAARELREKYDV